MSATADLDVTLQTRAAERFDPLSEAERKLLAALPSGLTANCGAEGLAWDAPENNPARGDAWDHDRTIRAALLAWLCSDAKATEQIHHRGIRLTGACIDGVFDLSFLNVPFPLSFGACSWPQGMRLRGAAIPELVLQRCRIGPLPSGEGRKTAIMAAGLRVQNVVFLTGGFRAEGEVCLINAEIGGLECTSGSRFKNANGPALSATRAKIGGPVFLADDFQAEGEVLLLGAEISGGLECGGGSRFKNANGPALNAERAKISGPVLLRDDFQAEGEVLLRDAEIGGLGCSGGSGFKNANGPALNAARAKIGGPVFLGDDFQAESEVLLRDAEISGGLECGGGSRFKNANGPALNAERAKISGPVLLRDDFQAEGEVLLRDAEIGGLGCSGGSGFKNANGPALSATRAKIGGPVFLRDDFQAEGEVLLRDAEISGGLECSRGSRFKNANGPALNAERAKIGGPVLLRDDFQAEGEVLLLDAEIGGLECGRGSRFKNANGPALSATRAKIGADVLLYEDFRVEGSVRLLGATVRGNVEIENHRPAVTDGTPTFDLTLYGARIDGALIMRGLRCASDTVVDLEDTSCNVLADAKEGWPSAGNLRLDGFVYRRLRDPLTEIRLDWLRRELPSDEAERRGRFRPQPYRQLAGVLRAHGLDAEAKEVLIGMAQDRRRWAKLGRLSRVWQWILWITIRNGHHPLRAGRWLLILWLVGFPAFGLGYQMQVMVPSERFAYDGFAQGALPGQYEPFCALVYSIDTSLPIIGFGQKDRWHPRLMEKPPPRDGNDDGVSGLLCKADFTRRLDPNSVWVSRATLATSLEVYRWFHLAFGWFLATMLLAGISGLVGRE